MTTLACRVRQGLFVLLVAIFAPLAAMAAPYAAMVMDMRTGEVLYSRNADTPLYPASLTKMMTLYITFQAVEHGEFDLDSLVTVTKHAASQPPSRLGLRPGQKIAVRYLIRAAAIKSANDAAAALGDYIGGDEAGFAARMNRTARQLGMTHTHFVNANGLTRKGHLSSAHDMTILGRHLFFDFPQYYNIFSRISSDAKVATVYSSNRKFLQAYKGADGIKTGYTVASGFNLCASAKRGSKRVIGTIFGATSVAARNAQMADLLDKGFKRMPTRVATNPPAIPQYIPPGRESGRILLAGKPLAPKQSPRPDLRPHPPETDGDAIALALAGAVSRDTVDATGVDTPKGPAEPEIRADDVRVASADEGIGILITSSPRPVLSPRDKTARVAEAQAGPAAGAGADVEHVQLASYEPAKVIQPGQYSSDGPRFVQATSPQPETQELAQALIHDMGEESRAGGDTVDTASKFARTTRPQPETGELAGIKPENRPETMILAALNPSASDPDDTPRIVARLSSSGGRNWGVSLGLYNSRFQAERHLLTTALMDSDTLGDALRKVAQRKTGYEANFVGMSEDMAQLACARLQARAMDCKVTGP